MFSCGSLQCGPGTSSFFCRDLIYKCFPSRADKIETSGPSMAAPSPQEWVGQDRHSLRRAVSSACVRDQAPPRALPWWWCRDAPVSSLQAWPLSWCPQLPTPCPRCLPRPLTSLFPNGLCHWSEELGAGPTLYCEVFIRLSH